MKLLLAGGGTAGHIEPALAVARGWISSHPTDEILFLGTAHGLEKTLVPAAGFTLLQIPKVAIARNLSPSLLKVPFQLIASIAMTMKHLKGVDCAVGFGGYVSAPLYIAASLKRVPLVIHEQNAYPGWANRIGARFTKFVASSYEVEHGALKTAQLTGLPLRQDVIASVITAQEGWSKARRMAKERVCEKYGFQLGDPLLFIFGGSQGSKAINTVIEDSRALFESKKVSLLHGVGKKNEVPESTKRYRALSYIDEMADCYLAADILIARSGAVTCAEASALSRYSLFIPLPVGNGEQALNADALVRAGRAQVLPQAQFSSKWLESNIDNLLAESQRRPDEGDASGVHAVDKIVNLIEEASGVK